MRKGADDFVENTVRAVEMSATGDYWKMSLKYTSYAVLYTIIFINNIFNDHNFSWNFCLLPSSISDIQLRDMEHQPNESKGIVCFENVQKIITSLESLMS